MAPYCDGRKRIGVRLRDSNACSTEPCWYWERPPARCSLIMTKDRNRRPDEPITFQQAEEACERLPSEIERAKKVLRKYRAAMRQAPSPKDNC